MPREKDRSKAEFVDWTLSAIIWVRGHWRGVLEFIGLAAVVFAVVVGSQSYWRYRSGVAAEKLYAAVRKPAESDERMKALESLVDDYSRTPAGKQGMMMLGDMYLTKGEFDKAASQFKMLAGRSRNQPLMYVAAMHKLAETELAKGDSLGAADTYLKAAADPHNLVASLSRFLAAACFEKGGDVEQAKKLYKQVVDEAKEGDDFAKRKSEERLIWLEVAQNSKG